MVQCGACNGDGGSWVTADGDDTWTNNRVWVPCTACNGTGEK